MLQHPYHLQHGKIKNFFDKEKLSKIVNVFDTFERSYHEYQDTSCRGVAPGHQAMPWVKKLILDPIFEKFKGDIKPFFVMLLDCDTPFGIHQDHQPLKENQTGHHYLTFLIPYSVDNNVNLVNEASTIIYDKNGDDFSLREELAWETGDLLWWDSSCWHSSNDFKSKHFSTKQALVIQTYV